MSKEWKAGDHLRVARAGGVYFHHGLYVGADSVIHYEGSVSGGTGMVVESGIERFSDGNSVRRVDHAKPRYSRGQSVKRAQSRLKEDKYSLVFNNCEHFVNWCIEGEERCKQLEVLAKQVARAGVMIAAQRISQKAVQEVAARSLASALEVSLLRTGAQTVVGKAFYPVPYVGAAFIAYDIWQLWKELRR